MKISRILHAGYVFELDGAQVAFDPIFENPFSRNCYAYPAVDFAADQIRQLRLSAVFISHFHDDHCSLESLNLLRRETPIYIFSLHEELPQMIRELGFQQVHSLALNIAIDIGGFSITPRRALDADVDSLFHIEAAGLHILNVVDSWIDPETLDLLCETKNWDLVLWPFQTMREIEVLSPLRHRDEPSEIPPEWFEQLRRLNPRNLIASSCQFIHEAWSYYNHALFPISYAQFHRELAPALPQTQILRLNPGCSLSFADHALVGEDPLPWIRPRGDQNVDYDYRPSQPIPETAEIARRFPQLSDEESKAVIRFCQEGLPRRFRELEESTEDYFRKSRNWRLSVFDGNGQPAHFDFCVRNQEIRQACVDPGDFAWCTEITAFKLHSALYDGESLTSVYLRINPRLFSEVIEQELRGVDILEDPLVRGLFTQSFASYQAAQLKKLLGPSDSQ